MKAVRRGILIYAGIVAISALWAPLWWFMLVHSYQEGLGGTLYTIGYHVKHYLVIPTLALWLGALPLSLCSIFLVKTAKEWSVATIVPVVIIGGIIIYGLIFLGNPASGDFGGGPADRVSYLSRVVGGIIAGMSGLCWLHLLLTASADKQKNPES